jgi:hypothetical protein
MYGGGLLKSDHNQLKIMSSTNFNYNTTRTMINKMKGLHENRPLHLHAVEPGNPAGNHRCSIWIESLTCWS